MKKKKKQIFIKFSENIKCLTNKSACALCIRTQILEAYKNFMQIDNMPEIEVEFPSTKMARNTFGYINFEL